MQSNTSNTDSTAVKLGTGDSKSFWPIQIDEGRLTGTAWQGTLESVEMLVVTY